MRALRAGVGGFVGLVDEQFADVVDGEIVALQGRLVVVAEVGGNRDAVEHVGGFADVGLNVLQADVEDLRIGTLSREHDAHAAVFLAENGPENPADLDRSPRGAPPRPAARVVIDTAEAERAVAVRNIIACGAIVDLLLVEDAVPHLVAPLDVAVHVWREPRFDEHC